MKSSFYKSLSLSTIRQQLTIVYVIPLNKSKNLKFILGYDDIFPLNVLDGGHPWKLI